MAKRLFLTLFLAGLVLFNQNVKAQAPQPVSTGLSYWYAPSGAVVNPSTGVVSALNNLVHPTAPAEQASYYTTIMFGSTGLNPTGFSNTPSVSYGGDDIFLIQFNNAGATTSYTNGTAMIGVKTPATLSGVKTIYNFGDAQSGMALFLDGNKLAFTCYGLNGAADDFNRLEYTVIANKEYIVTAQFDAVSQWMELFINGVSIARKSILFSAFNLPNTYHGSIGGLYTATSMRVTSSTTSAAPSYYQGEISSLLVYNNRSLSTNERYQSESYLRYGTSLSGPLALNDCFSCVPGSQLSPVVRYETATTAGSFLTDLSGNGWNGNAGTLPTYTVNAIGTKSAVQFATGREVLIPSTMMLDKGSHNEERLYNLVIKPTDIVTKQYIYKQGDMYRGVGIYIDNNALKFDFFQSNGSGSPGSWGLASNSYPLTNTGALIITINDKVSGTSITVNGNAISMSPFPIARTVDGWSKGSAFIGGNLGGTYNGSGGNYTTESPYTGYIAEFSIYNRGFNTEELALLYNTQATKYGITINQNLDYYRWQEFFANSVGGLNALVSSSCSDELLFKTNTALSNAYLHIGNNKEIITDLLVGDHTFSSSTFTVPTNVTRTKRTWRVDKAVPGSYPTFGGSQLLDFSIKVPSFPITTILAHQQPVLIIDADGDFSKDAKIYTLTKDIPTNTYVLPNITVNAGDFISLGVINLYEYSATYPYGTQFIYQTNSGTNSNLINNTGIKIKALNGTSDYNYLGVAVNNTSGLSFSGTAPYALSCKWAITHYNAVGPLEFTFDPASIGISTPLAGTEEYVLAYESSSLTYNSLTTNYLRFDLVGGVYKIATLTLPNIKYEFTVLRRTKTPVTQVKTTSGILTLSSPGSGYIKLYGKDVYDNGSQTQYNNENSQCPKSVKKAYVYLTFNTGDNYLFGNTAFTTQVQVNVKARKTANNATFLDYGNFTLNLDQNKPEQLQVIDVTDYENQYPYEEYTITPIGYTAPSNTTIANALQLKAELIKEKKVMVLQTTDPIITSQAAALSGTNKSCTFTWTNTFCDPYTYQFQLLRLFNGTTTSIPTLETTLINAPLDWSKALTLETKNQSLTLTLVEGTGYYAWRVRPVGNYYDGDAANNQNWGTWNTDAIALTAPLNFTAATDLATNYKGAVLYYSQFDEDKNFIYNRVFTEDTKIHEGMSYANGLQQIYQTQAKLNSNGTNGQVVISEPVYDFSGRASLQSMAAPDQTNNDLGYRNSALVKGTDKYNAFNFDDDTKLATPDPIDNGLINLYYSDLNTDPQIPDAENYPYSRTLYDNDGQNRAKEQSGVGKTHSIGNKTATTEYSTASDMELLRVFGDEAPKGNTVLKTKTTDQNNISSITYTDLSGKVIATSIVKNDKPSNLEALPGLQTIHIVDQLNNNVPIGNNGVTATKKYTFSETTTLNVSLDLTPDILPANGNCAGICRTCSYTAIIKVIDEKTNLTVASQPISIDGESIPCGEGTKITKNVVIPNIPTGTYSITKTVQVDESKAAVFAQTVRDQVDHDLQTNFLDINVMPLVNDKKFQELANYFEWLYTHQSTLPAGFSMSVNSTPAYIAGAHLKTGDEVKIGPSCCAVTIPIILPVLEPCEQYTIDLATLSPTVARANFGYTLATRYETACLPTNPFPMVHTELGSYTKQNLQDLFANMLTESYYTCDDIWNAWHAQIALKEAKFVNPNDPTTGFSNLNTQAGTQINGDFSSVNVNTALTEASNPISVFLNEMKRKDHINGFIETQSDDLRIHAYKYFYYSRSSQPASGTPARLCEDRYCGNPALPADLCTAPSCSPAKISAVDGGYTLQYNYTSPTGTLVLNQANNQVIADFYFCINKSLPVATNPTVVAQQVDDYYKNVLAKKTEMEAKCASTCDDRRDEFIASLRNLYDSDHNGSMINGLGQTITEGDLCCLAGQMVEYCKDQCYLSVVRDRCTGTPNYSGEPVKLLSVGTADEVNTVEAIIGGSFILQDASVSACSTDYKKVEICKNIVGIYHLNGLSDQTDYAHPSDATYQLSYNGNSFNVGRTGASTQSINTPGMSANCTKLDDRGITNAVTISAWVRMNDAITAGTTNVKYIVKKMDATSGFQLYTKFGYAYFDVMSGGTTYSSGPSIYDLTFNSGGNKTNDPFIKDIRWHLVTGVLRGNTVEIWIDGQLQRSTTAAGTIGSISTTTTLYIGTGGAGTETFEGQIDEVYLHSCALQKASILDLYNTTQTSNLAFGITTPLVEGCGSQAPDKLMDTFSDNTGEGGTYFGDLFGTFKAADGRIWSYGFRAGYPNSYPYLDIVDQSGNHQDILFTAYNIGSVTGIIKTADGNYLITGIYTETSTSTNSFFRVKLDVTGAIIWQNSSLTGTSGLSFDSRYSGKVFETNGHLYFMCTQFSQVDVIELDPLTGNVLNSNVYLTGNYYDNYTINNQINNKHLVDGNYVYISGKTSIIKLDIINHTIVWERNTLTDGDPMYISAMQLVDNGQKIIFTGTVDYSSGIYHKIGIRKINTSNASNGSYEWQQTWSESNHVNLGVTASAVEFLVTPLSADRMAICGIYYTTSSQYAGFSIVVSSNGNMSPIIYPNPVSTDFGNRVGDYQVLGFKEVSDGYVMYGVNGFASAGYVGRIKFLVKFNQSFQIVWRRLSPQASAANSPFGGGVGMLPNGIYLDQFNNKSILISNNVYWGDGSTDPDLTYSSSSTPIANGSWWFLNIGFYNTCPDRPLCIKWIPPADVVDPIDPPPVYLTPKDLIKDQLTNVIYDQIGQCYGSVMTEAMNQYMSRCKGTINEYCTVSYDITVGQFTLYYYDRAGNLVKTVPPAGVNFLTVDPAHIEDARQLHPGHQLVTYYKYNSLGQLTEQTTPDGGTTAFRYNKLGMLRFSQNAEQITVPSNSYSYTKYDALGRSIESGQAVLQSGQTINTLFPDAQGVFTNFELTSFPTANKSQETFTVYSDAATHINYLGAIQQYLRNRVSYSFTNGMDGNKSVSYFSYDPHGNVKWIVQELPGIGKSTIGYEYDLISNKVLKVKLNENRSDQFFHRYFYDADNRITCAQTSSNNYQWDTDAKYNYYKHGPLRRTELGEDHVQGLDYTYTIQGWLKAVNAPTLNATLDPGQDGVGASVFQKDEYGFVLGYYGAQTGFHGDFQRGTSIFNAPIAGTLDSTSLSSNKPLYNGNITSWVTRINADLGYQLTGNLYNYDALNRIRGSQFYSRTSANPFALPFNNDYTTTYTYDGNGNIVNLTRKGVTGTALDLDNLTYNYDYTGSFKTNNRLRSVTDGNGAAHSGTGDIGTQSANNYVYDGIGNLSTDQAENSKIIWNVYGKVSEVKQNVPVVGGKSELRFVYDAMGNRIEKEENTVPYTSGLVAQRLPENLITTYYVRDASGNVMSIYQRKNTPVSGQPNYYTATYTRKEVPLYGSSRLGMQDEREQDVVIATKIFHKDDYFKVTFDFSQVDQKTEMNNWLATSSVIDNLAGSNLSSVSLNSINFNTSTPVSAAIANIQNFAGVEGKDVSVAENDNGQVLFYTTTLKKHWGKSNVLLLFDANGNIMLNSGGMYADANARSVIVQSPVSDQQYLLFTRNATDKKLYYHIIDLSLQGNGATASIKQGDVKTKNIALDASNTYGTHLLAIEDRSAKKAYIYATHYIASATPQSTIGTTDLTLFEVSNNGTSLVKAPSSLCAQISSWDDIAQSELQISADGKKFTMINHQQNLGWYGAQKTQAIVFNMGANYRLASNLIVDATIVPVGISYPHQSTDFSADSRFMYYSQQRLTAKPGDLNVMGRFDLRNNIQSANLFLARLPQIQRSKLGKVYAYQSTNRWDAYVESSTGVSSASPTDDLTFAYLAGGSTINNYLPIQNRIVYRISGVNPLLFSRRVGKKYYELSDHLGNVTVVVSDEVDATGSSFVNKAHVDSYNNYYAFGMVMPGRTMNSTTYRYGFNGKEKDDKIASNNYDFGARIYDARISKWLSVDPMNNQYPSHTPYGFGLNSPIKNIDKEGEYVVDANNQRVVFNYDEGGNVTGVANLSSLDQNTQTVLNNMISMDYGKQMLTAMDKYQGMAANGKMEDEYFQFTFGKTDDGSIARTYDVSYKEGKKTRTGYELRLDVDDYASDKRYSGISKNGFIYLISIHEPAHKVNKLGYGLSRNGSLATFEGAFGELVPFNIEYAALVQWSKTNVESVDGIANYVSKTVEKYQFFNSNLTADDVYKPEVFGSNSLRGSEEQKKFMKTIGVQMGESQKKVDNTVENATTY